jgi:hypothetical protein
MNQAMDRKPYLDHLFVETSNGVYFGYWYFMGACGPGAGSL